MSMMLPIIAGEIIVSIALRATNTIMALSCQYRVMYLSTLLKLPLLFLLWEPPSLILFVSLSVGDPQLQDIVESIHGFGVLLVL